jgi:hypothetical protein
MIGEPDAGKLQRVRARAAGEDEIAVRPQAELQRGARAPGEGRESETNRGLRVPDAAD